MKPYLPPKTGPSHISSQRHGDDYAKEPIQKIAVLFTDIVGSTRFFKSQGDLAGREMLQRHQDIASGCVTEHGGAVVKILGDSVMAYFLNAKEALKSAIKIQQQFQVYNQQKDPQNQIHLRIGIHFGDGIIEENDIFGNVVNIAAKLTPLVDSDQIYISRELYELVRDLSSVRFETVTLSDKEEVPSGLTIHRVIWEEAVTFDPLLKTLLYFKPIWNIAEEDFTDAWGRLLAVKDNIWGGKIEKESILADRSVLLIVNEAPLAPAIAKVVIKFIKKSLRQESESQVLPVQIFIDSGPYLRADRIVVEGLQSNWDEMHPGHIYVSASAYTFMKNKPNFSAIPDSDTHRHKPLYRLIPKEEKDDEKGSHYLFFYQKALIQGKNPPCYYCGNKKHLATNCPSKHLQWRTRFLEKLGYLPFDMINKLFFNYIAGKVPKPEPGKEPEMDTLPSTLWAYYGFYDLRRTLQLRFFANIWNATTESWNDIKETSSEEDKGGLLWIALDCLRVSNLAQAEAYLKSSLEKDPQEYRPYCIMGFLNMEKKNFLGAEHYFDQALYHARTEPQKIFLLFLLCHLYDINDRPFKASEKIREILLLNPYCEEAIYQDIIFKFREGKSPDALRLLTKFIQNNRQFYINAMIDPELAPFSKIIHPELKRLFEQAKDEAVRIPDKAENDLKEFERLMSEKDIKEARSFQLKLKELSRADSYFAYLDIIYYGEAMLAICRRSIDKRRDKLLEILYELNSRVEKYLDFVSNYSYRKLISALYQQLILLQTIISQTRRMANSNVPEEFKEALARPQKFSHELDQIESKLKRLETIQLVALSFNRFLKSCLIFQSAVVIFAIIVFPIIIYYLNLLLSKYGMSPVLNIWSYQKGILIIGGISALFLAAIRTIKKLYEQ